ncbi:hypothetical protein ACN38_g12512 [Penicillium nordicum]|uniref:Uncharacterized protein n=1 Tax=Penicillium nordicum TaxID=229535 RepID=A0A0M8NYD8_9EURO|nr:hypothetical protein ACN38_g12512 [Penicillium nordicum]
MYADSAAQSKDNGGDKVDHTHASRKYRVGTLIAETGPHNRPHMHQEDWPRYTKSTKSSTVSYLGISMHHQPNSGLR